MYSINKEEFDNFWSERERAGSYDPYMRPSKELIAILKGLRPLWGVSIIDLKQKDVDSGELINVSRPRQEIEIAMLQLRNESMVAKESDKIVILNNLGCVYALLDRYSEAKETLQEVSNLAKEKEQSSVILNNLGCVYALLDRYSEAKEALQKAIELASKGEVKYDFRENLAMVNRMAKR
jgi:Flp pilus assembly protein TadD